MFRWTHFSRWLRGLFSVLLRRNDRLPQAENPGCFDDPDKTFIDLYMKSGLYITKSSRGCIRVSR